MRPAGSSALSRGACAAGPSHRCSTPSAAAGGAAAWAQRQRRRQQHHHPLQQQQQQHRAALRGAFADPPCVAASFAGAGGCSGALPEGRPPVRRIILLRHADSEASAATRDHERPISDHGRGEAARIAQRLREIGWAPDLIIASNSRRTKMTLDVMAEADAALCDVDAHYLGSLYTVAALDGQTRTHLEEVIRGVACDTANFCVMCVGHNKGWEEAASSFARQAVRLHTASAALFEAAARTWQDATAPEVEWRLVQIITP